MDRRRATQIGLCLCVVIMAALGVVVSAAVVPEPGVVPGEAGGTVISVDPGGPVWRNHIRAGSTVVSIQSSDAPGGWAILVEDPSGIVRDSSTQAHTAALRELVPGSLVALLAALVAALVAYRRRSAAAWLIPIAMLLAAQPLFVTGSVPIAMLAGIAVFAGGALGAVSFTPWRRSSIVPPAVGFALAALWAASMLVLPDLFDALDAVRVPAAVGLSLMGAALAADGVRISGVLTGRSGPAFVDLVSLGGAAAVVVAGAIGAVPLAPALLVVLVAIAVQPVWRRATVTAFDGLVTAQARRDASIRAVEDERRRLAWDIHDAPLQELSGVIRRLDDVSGAEDEATALRSIAGHLREVATTLHPPVLQDLGLAAALEDLRERLAAKSPSWEVVAAVDDRTNDRRPPSSVELAAYRIVQEATANAISHSGGHRLSIRGSVASEVIDLRVVDDGHGLRDDAARAARRAGHFGLDSMRERAEAEGGSTTLSSSRDGVTVRFRWTAGT